MKKKNFIKIITNILLFTAFIFTYFLDLTGLEMHQYLGVAAGGFLIVHIITHAQWIKQVSARFFKKLSKKVRFYYMMDIILLISIVVITVSGIIISTWLTISYEIYPLIRDIHIISSIAGLALLILKLAFHWKFFTSLFQRISIPKFHQPEPAAVLATPTRTYSRREAIKTIGAVSIVGVLGLYKAVKAMSIPVAASPLPAPEVKTANSKLLVQPTPTVETTAEAVVQESSGGGQQRRRGQGKSEGESHEATDYSTAVIQPTPESVIAPAQPTPMPQTQECVVRCPRGCSYPGQCRRYIDENGNQFCDLGECLPV